MASAASSTGDNTADNGAHDDFGLTGDCPLCGDPLPPIWENDGHTGRMACCGKLICPSCDSEKRDYMRRSSSGFHFKEEMEKRQLKNVLFHCPFCRADKRPDEDDILLKRSGEGYGWADYGLYFLFSLNVPKVGRLPRLDLAMKHLRLAAKRDFPIALNDLGDFYSRGSDKFDIEPSTLDARHYYFRAAEKGHAKARYRLAHSYLLSDNSGYCTDEDEEDIDKAIQLLDMAAEEGCIESFSELGNLHYPECGGKDDIDTALMYYVRGAELREESALYLLALACDHQSDLSKKNIFSESHDSLINLINDDPSTAVMGLFELAARQGCVPSQEKLSSCLIQRVVEGGLQYFSAGINWMLVAKNNKSEVAMEQSQSESIKNVVSKICFNCYDNAKGEGEKFNACSRCKLAHYCSKKCQIEHWKKGGHKNICGTNKFVEWTRKDACEKSLDPCYVGIDPPQKDG